MKGAFFVRELLSHYLLTRHFHVRFRSKLSILIDLRDSSVDGAGDGPLADETGFIFEHLAIKSFSSNCLRVKDLVRLLENEVTMRSKLLHRNGQGTVFGDNGHDRLRRFRVCVLHHFDGDDVANDGEKHERQANNDVLFHNDLFLLLILAN